MGDSHTENNNSSCIVMICRVWTDRDDDVVYKGVVMVHTLRTAAHLLEHCCLESAIVHLAAMQDQHQALTGRWNLFWFVGCVMSVCVHACTCVCTYVCVFVFMCAVVCVCVCLHVCSCVCVCAHVHICACVCVCVCVSLCVFVFILFVCAHTCEGESVDGKLSKRSSVTIYKKVLFFQS